MAGYTADDVVAEVIHITICQLKSLKRKAVITILEFHILLIMRAGYYIMHIVMSAIEGVNMIPTAPKLDIQWSLNSISVGCTVG